MTTSTTTVNKFDDLLTELGTGKWNLIFILGISVWAYLTPYHLLAPVYLAPALKYTCIPPEGVTVIDSNLTNACEFKVDSSNLTSDIIESLLSNTSKLTGTSSNEGKKNHTIACTTWEYDHSLFTHTLTDQFNLVCTNEVWRATYGSIYFLGKVIGALISGILSDKCGRKLVFGCGVVVQGLVGVSSIWYTNYYLILIARFVLGFCFPTTITTGFTLALEVCEPKHRGTAGILLATPWAIACMTWGGLAYLIRDWQTLQMVVTIPCLFFIPVLWLYDESPRWLIVNGKHDKAMKVLKKAARWNHSTLPADDELRKVMKEIQMESKTVIKAELEGRVGTPTRTMYNMFVLFRTPYIRKITLLSYIVFIAAGVIYYGMSLNGVNYTDDPFLYITLGGLMEIPAYTLTIPLINTWGRRTPTALGYLLCGVFIFGLAFIPRENTWIVMTLAMLGKMCIAASYQIYYLYGNELFPTEVRLQGFGSSLFLSDSFTLVCPYITEMLAPVYPWAPSLLFGILGIIAGLVTFCLPETFKKALPDTVADLEEWRIKKLREREMIRNRRLQQVPEREVLFANGTVSVEN